jgi:hypothetical protein
MTVRYFEELEIWKEARRITGEIYRLGGNLKFARDFGLSGQIQKAVVSIMSNIAEGSRRKSRVRSVPIYCERVMRRSAVPDLCGT